MSEWRQVRLGELFEIDNSKLGPHDVEPNVLSLSKYDGFVRADDYFDKRIASLRLDGYKPVPVGGWAFSTIHIDEGSIARNTVEPGVISPMYTTMTWVGGGIADAAFLGQVVRQPAMLAEYKRRAQGSINRRRSLPFRTFAEIEIPLPGLKEQRRIVAVMAAVDGQIEALGVEVESASRSLDLVRDDYPQTKDVPLGEVLLNIDSGKSVQTDGASPTANHPRILKVSAVRPGLFQPDKAKSLDAAMPETARVGDGDLLMTRSNTPDRVGFCARARNVPNGTFMPDLIWRLRVDEERVDLDYLEQILSAPEIRRRVTATATGTSASMRKINKKGIATVSVPLPALQAQLDYSARCQSLSTVLDVFAHELTTLRAVRAHLLTALLLQEISVDEAVDQFVEVPA